MEANVEVRIVVWADIGIIIRVNSGPIIIVKLLFENLALIIDQLFDCDSFLQHVRQIVLEQVRRNVRVLILADVVDHQVHCFYLIVFERIVNGRVVVKRILVVLFWRLGPVDHGVRVIEVI